MTGLSTRPAALLLSLLAVLPAPLAGAAPGAGKITGLDVNSVTRTHAAAWLKAHLPAAARGSRQSFSGTVSVGAAAIPVAQPVTVMVQPVGDGFDAVFLLELDLGKVTESVVANLGGDALAFSIAGTLTGEGGSRAAASGSGSLRIGTPDLRARSAEATTFVRFAGARFAGLSLKETKGEATLKVLNPLGAPLGIEEIRYELFANCRKVAEGVRTKVRLHPGRENELILPVVASNADLLAAAGDAAVHGGTVSGWLTGKVTVKTGASRRVVPIDLTGAVSLLP